MENIVQGPILVTGGQNPVAEMERYGASLFARGAHIIDPRLVQNIGSAPGIPQSAKGYGVSALADILCVDAQPVALSNTVLAAAQATTASTAMTLASADASGISCKIPLVPLGQAFNAANRVTPAMALDYGFTSGNTTAGSKSVTNIPAGHFRFFKAGQPIIIAGAGAAANTPLITRVSATPAWGATTLTIDDAAGQSVTGGRIGTSDPLQIGAWPFINSWGPSGPVALSDPHQLLGRAVSITGNAGSLAANFTVVGYDVWGNRQTEVIAFAGGATTAAGKKAFKYIVSVTPDTSDAGHLLSVGTTDVFGIPLRSPLFEYADLFWNGALITSSTGYVAANDTNPNGTGADPRGTYAVQSASDGTKRLVIIIAPSAYDLDNAGLLDYKSLFGVPPS